MVITKSTKRRTRAVTLKDVLQQLKMPDKRQVIVLLGALCVLLGSSFLVVAVFSSDLVAIYLFMFAGMFAIVVGLRVWVRLSGASEEQIGRLSDSRFWRPGLDL
jgi:TctA family transporter